MARCGVDVHVSSVTIIWSATKLVVWFHGCNGNSHSLKVVHGTVQPSTQGGSFYIHERYVDIWLLVVGLTVWQVWVSRCKETFTGKRTPPIESLMMLWFNLISTLQGEFESLRGPSDASEEASSRPFPSEMERFSDGYRWWMAMQSGFIKPPRWLFPPRVRNI